MSDFKLLRGYEKYSVYNDDIVITLEIRDALTLNVTIIDMIHGLTLQKNITMTSKFNEYMLYANYVTINSKCNEEPTISERLETIEELLSNFIN